MDAIGWLWLAWRSVAACFAMCGIVTDVAEDEGDDIDQLEDPGDDSERLLCNETYVRETYVTMDGATLATDVAGDDWEAAIVAKARGESLEEEDDGSRR